MNRKGQKRRSLSKKERTLLASKTNFRCGYCGNDLPDRFHVDHIIPFEYSGDCSEKNLLAACPQCNNFKSVLSLEQFRRELSYQAERAFKRSVNCRMAHKYGQIRFTPSDIVFYFETLQNDR